MRQGRDCHLQGDGWVADEEGKAGTRGKTIDEAIGQGSNGDQGRGCYRWRSWGRLVQWA